jgi:hypothetical protein
MSAKMIDDPDIRISPVPACILCGQPLPAETTLSLGRMAACNRFEHSGGTSIETHPVSMSQCGGCDLVQLSSFPPIEFVCPRVPWIRYNEPMAHLDALAGRLRDFFPGKDASAIGVGPFDLPLLERLRKYGISCASLDLAALVPAGPGRFPYLEAIQESLRPQVFTEIARRQSAASLISCRYLLEHTHNPVAALQALRLLADANGVLLVEIPDSTKFLSSLDYSFIWEEHICYFTEETFRAAAFQAGFDVAGFFRYPGALEDAMVFILRPSLPTSGTRAPPRTPDGRDAFQRFHAGFDEVRQKYARMLDSVAKSGRKTVVFGAGHQSIMFINALGLQRYVSSVIDDSPDKIGCLIPGTRIEIVSSDNLINNPEIGLCLLGVAPEAESKIRTRFAGYLDRGGRMYSIFPATGNGTLINHEEGK